MLLYMEKSMGKFMYNMISMIDNMKTYKIHILEYM